MKQCSNCKQFKELYEFNKNCNSKDGYYHRCRLCHKEFNRQWRLKNIDRCKKVSTSWKKNNREKNLETIKKWQKKQFESHSNYALAHLLRTRLNTALKGNYKAGSAVADLGCTIEEFRKHIESQFLPGMNWNNRGRWGESWHIDHVKPLAHFDLTDRRQFVEACNYKNMQPMWCVDNNVKADS